MVKSIELNKNFQYNALDGKKLPHSISQPVIHYENGKYYISAFVFFYNKEDIQSGMVNRPTLWIIADINTGEIIERRNTNDIDFSDAPYNIKYNIQMTEKCDTSKTYYEETVMEVRSSNLQIDSQNEPKYIGFDFVVYL